MGTLHWDSVMRYSLVTVAMMAAGLITPAHGETIRCGSWVIDESVTVEELVRKCGEPASKRSEEQDVRVRSPNDGASNTRKIGTTVTEFWTYERGRQASPVLVTIMEGKIRSIERIK
jgi:Protein of unknown function (DUF2845)